MGPPCLLEVTISARVFSNSFVCSCKCFPPSTSRTCSIKLVAKLWKSKDTQDMHTKYKMLKNAGCPGMTNICSRRVTHTLYDSIRVQTIKERGCLNAFSFAQQDRKSRLRFFQRSKSLFKAHEVIETKPERLEEVMFTHVLPFGETYVVRHCKGPGP